MDNNRRGLANASKDMREEVARMGGEAVSKDREHMARIGSRGGERSAENRSRREKDR